jgi:PAS domain S-box-containing protein
MQRNTTQARAEDHAVAHLAAIVMHAHDAIISKTLDGTVVSWNPTAERMFGYSAAEIIGKSIVAIIPPERLHEEDEILGRLRRGEIIDHFETERVRKDGQRIPISLTISPIRRADGAIIATSARRSGSSKSETCFSCANRRRARKRKLPTEQRTIFWQFSATSCERRSPRSSPAPVCYATSRVMTRRPTVRARLLNVRLVT